MDDRHDEQPHLSASSERDEQWSPLSELAAPYQSRHGDTVLVSDAWQRKVLLVQRTGLLDLLTEHFLRASRGSPVADALRHELEREGLLNPSTMSDDDRARLMHWWQRGWSGSLDYFLWSQLGSFYDSSDLAGDRRREAIQAYLEEGGPPPARLRPEGHEVPLPPIGRLPHEATMGHVLMERRTVRGFVRKAVPATTLSNVLWYGLAAVRSCRAASASEDIIRYLDSYGVAFDFYLVLYAVDGVASGIYFYDVEQHSLVLVKSGDCRREMTANLFGQTAPLSAAWTLILVADFPQYAWRYRHERALRNLYIDAGRIAHEMLTVAGAEQLGSFMTPALRDQAVGTWLELDAVRQAPLYSLAMGMTR